ncbi:MAG: RNA polymerase sigma factor [Pseudomonadales bacterium]
MSEITRVFLKFRRQLERHVSRFVSLQHVDDIVQETFVKSVEAELNRDIQYAKSYLLRTAQNIALNHRDKWDNKFAAPLEDLATSDVEVDEPESNAPEKWAQSSERFMRFCAAADQLDGNIKKAFILKKVYGQSQREIARHLNLSESTVEKHVAKGLKHCADYLAQQENAATAVVGKRSKGEK